MTEIPVQTANETEEHLPVLLEYTEEKRRHDRGGQQIAILRDIYRFSDPHMRGMIMGRFDGADELYALALDSRHDVKLDENERDFIDYMSKQAKNVRISAMLDWDKLEGEEADEIAPNISRVIERIPLAVAEAKQAGDEAKAKRLTAQLPYLKVYKHLKSGESDNELVDITEAGSKNHLGEYTGKSYMTALMEMKLAQRDMMMPTADKLAAAEKFKQAKKLLELRGTLFFMQAVAMEAIYEHAPEFRNDNPEVSDDMDPRFVYEDSRGESPKQKPKNAEGMSWVEEPDNPYDFAIQKGRAALKYGKWRSEMTKAEKEAAKHK